METTLDRIGVGEKATVVLACADNETSRFTIQRLLHQGIVTGAVVEVVRRTTGGGRILAVGQSRLALDPQVLRGIVVAEGEPGHFPKPGDPIAHSERMIASHADATADTGDPIAHAGDPTADTGALIDVHGEPK